MSQTIKKLDLLNEKTTVDNYPYGRKQCEMTFAVEHKTGKGFRTWRQSKNPTTGRLNKPKLSTYYSFLAMYMNEDNHVKYYANNIRGIDDVKNLQQWLKVHADQINLTDEESQTLWCTIVASYKISMAWFDCKEGFTIKDALEASPIKDLITCYGSHAPIQQLIDVELDRPEMEAMRKTKS